MNNIELRDIRFPIKNSVKLLRGNIINRSSISSNYTNNVILIPNVSFPLASRIFKYTDIEVNIKDNWIYIKNNNLGALRDAYLPYREVIEKEDPIEDTTQFINNNYSTNDAEKGIIDLDIPEQITIQHEQSSKDLDIEKDTTFEDNDNNQVESDTEEKLEDTQDNGDVDYYDYTKDDDTNKESENSDGSDTMIVEQQLTNNQPNHNNRVYNNQHYTSNKHKKKH